MLAGLLAGAAALAIIFMVLRKAAFRIPLGSFFTATSVLLYAMAVVFVGQGIASFQESGVTRATFVDYVPAIQVVPPVGASGVPAGGVEFHRHCVLPVSGSIESR